MNKPKKKIWWFNSDVNYKDSYAIWSIRKLNPLYDGSCMEIVTSTGITQNIGFVDNFVDVDTIVALTGSGSCWINKWYDQIGNNNFVNNEANSTKPILIENGILRIKNGRLSPYFNGTSTRMIVPNSQGNFNFIHNGTRSKIFVVSSCEDVGNTNTSYTLIGNEPSTAGIGFTLRYWDFTGQNNSLIQQINRGVNGFGSMLNRSAVNTYTSGQLNYILGVFDADNTVTNQRGVMEYNDGGSITNNSVLYSPPSVLNATKELSLGATFTTSWIFHHLGYINEVIIYDIFSVKKIQQIRKDINQFYNLF